MMIQPRQVLLFCALLLLFTITILEVCMHSHYSISQFVSVSATDTDTDTQVELRTLERGAAMPPPRVPSRSLLAPQHTALNGERTRAPSATSTTRPQWRIPRLFHQFARDVHLPAPYMMSLSGLLRHHRIRDPNAPAFAAAARNESFTRGAEERSDARSAHSVFNVSRSNCTHNSSLCASVFGFTPEPEPESRRSAAPLAGSSFDYYLWSDAAIKDFIANVRSDTNRAALQKYGHVLEQSDAVRYAILYEFGGVYLDMDVEFVAPIANYLERGYPCVFPEENPLQTAPNWKRTYIVTQSVIICRPHHPFLRLLLETLPEFNKRGITISRTGPHFVTEVLERYRRSNTTLEAICSVDARSHPDCVHVEAPHVFDSLDFFNSPSYVSYCRRRLDEVEKKSPKKLAEWRENAREASLDRHCVEFLESTAERGSPSAARLDERERLAVHHYLHLGQWPGRDRSCGTHVFDLSKLLRGYWSYETGRGMVYRDSSLDTRFNRQFWSSGK